MPTIKRITDTYFSKAFDLKSQFKQLTSYLISNRGIVVPSEVSNEIYKVKQIIPTIINQLFEQMVSTGYTDEFTLLYPVTQNNEDINSLPDLLSMHDIVIDLKTIPEAISLNSLYEFKDKILLNISNLVKITDRGVSISDINELHSMYVRGLLTRSYSLSDGWLNPSLCYYIIKTYSMVISSLIARNESLNYNDQLIVASILALYMSQKLSRDGEDLTRPSLFFKCTFLGNYSELNEIASRCASLSQNGLTIKALCELIAESGPSRLSRFNDGIFYRTCSALGGVTGRILIQIALEYPPYWTFLILNGLASQKFGSLVHYLKQNKLDASSPDAKRFLTDIRISRLLFETK